MKPITLQQEVGRVRAGRVECPMCGALVDAPCVGVKRKDGTRKPRTSAHIERVRASDRQRRR